MNPKSDQILDMAQVYGNAILIANHLQTLLDRALESYDLTARQWFLIACLDTFFEEPPRLGSLAETMGSSYQNVKQIALKLEKRGFVSIVNDPEDRRALRIVKTAACDDFFSEHAELSQIFLRRIFEQVEESELQALKTLLAGWASKVRAMR